MPVFYPVLILVVMGLETLSDNLVRPRNIYSSSRVARVLVYAFFILNGLVLAVFYFFASESGDRHS